MDIYAYARSIDYCADYMDYSTGRIYKIQDYGRDLRASRDNPDDSSLRASVARGIPVYQDGALIGYAKQM